MAFEPVPVVHLTRGRFPELPDAEPERALTELARRFGKVALVDAEGVRANDADLEFIQAAARKRSLWVDAGSRYATDAMDLFIAGAELVTMRWNTLRAPAELEEAAGLCQPGSLFVGLEFPKGRFLKHPKDARDERAVAELAETLGVGLVLQLDKPDAALLRALPGGPTRYAQGAPAAMRPELEALAFTGALVAPHEIPEAPP